MLQVSSMATPDEADPNDPQSFSQQMPDQEDVTSSVNGVPEEEQGINERFGLEMISLPQTHLDPQDLPDDYSPSLPVYVSVDIVDTVVPPPSAYVPFWAREVSASADLPLLVSTEDLITEKTKKQKSENMKNLKKIWKKLTFLFFCSKVS